MEMCRQIGEMTAKESRDLSTFGASRATQRAVLNKNEECLGSLELYKERSISTRD